MMSIVPYKAFMLLDLNAIISAAAGEPGSSYWQAVTMPHLSHPEFSYFYQEGCRGPGTSGSRKKPSISLARRA
ncbi:hypothetical protein C8F04DRAFT_1076741 [Mycena alexandri]|uniref:Uncharacterized protein n=1 Tax=Mycena alexandri TaxID=1745969 RepID=A0AAD6XBV7_9AGAR|nr:hypothetical protein C8F04DRAFT_1076741 [Mycena alexandri]